MIAHVSDSGARLWQRLQRIGSRYAPGINERQGIDLASGARASRCGASKHAFTLRRRQALVLAVPQRAFQLHIVPFEPPLSREQIMAVLQSRRMCARDQCLDLLVEPEERRSVAVFSLPRVQTEQWRAHYATTQEKIVAIEPDCHALWRYAQRQQADHQAWLVAMPKGSALYWPAAWPWAYHAEPLPSACALAPEDARHTLYSTVRRAGLMTGNDEPCQFPIRLAGSAALCQRWRACGDRFGWQCCGDVHPIAAGAALKGRRRWA